MRYLFTWDSICARQTPTFNNQLYSQAEQVRFALYVSQTRLYLRFLHPPTFLVANYNQEETSLSDRDSFIPMPAESSSADGLGEELAAFRHANSVNLIVQA
ncbi:hypothetical protein K504DRAFT_463168 [Pleomassaria siparia CBS 279.74]|uniref:Uncharacterized protein n=1 Tax=Pleomassaria siparia CBS 279.74 TaxID=1314801 RepID=A0A6G1JUU1_9PLEO|nr:hypothetical protein K504DRAFT_463168 [Pleomassaria siparia CBS 279.74]